MTDSSLLSLFVNHTGKQFDKWSGYLPVYDKLFAPYRHEPIRLLEIGVQNGGSLEVWSRYFSGAKRIVGCDIEPACAQLRYDDPRVAIVVGDAASDATHAQISKHSESFDIVLDDGSHRSGDIIRSFCRYFSVLEPGGMFVAEDLHCSYWMEYEGGLYDPASAVAFFKMLVDLVHRAHWGDDIPSDSLLEPFVRRYGQLELDASQIESVEFMDSICVVRKYTEGPCGIGDRLVKGTECEIRSGNAAFDGTELTPLDQTQNPYLHTVNSLREQQQDIDMVAQVVAMAQRERERHLEDYATLMQRLSSSLAETETTKHALKDTERQLNEHRHSIYELQASLSWRITAPLRSVLGLFLGLARWMKFVSSLFRLGGGPLRTWRLLARVLWDEGWSGVRWRLANARALVASANNTEGAGGSNNYEEWIRHYDTLDTQAIDRMKCRISEFEEQPVISVVLPVFNPPLQLLDQAILSVRAQIYPFWELCIADDASTDEAVGKLLRRHAEEDERIRIVFRKENGHISAASNSAIDLASGEFVALMDHDDLLPKHALYWVVDAINQHPDAQLIYSDEDKITLDGVRYDPYFKCGLNRELLLAQNMISHLGVYRRRILTTLGGFREGFEGAQDYDLSLRFLETISPKQVIHIPRVLYHWRAIPGSTALASGEKSYASDAGRRAVEEHLQRVGITAEVSPATQAPAMNRVRYALPEEASMVSILIPTRDRADLLAQCIESIQDSSTWKNYEIVIVDNGSMEAETFALFDRIRSKRVRILPSDSPFNFSALNNLAAREAQGEVICLLNNDIEVLTPDWMEEMLGFALQPDVGCVGARLWYPNGQLQHGGVLLGVGGVASHAHKHLAQNSPGYFGRAVLHQAYSAVTGACLMIRKNIYDQLGGLDEGLAVAFNDIDFCLRVRELGYRNVWTPYAELVHHESISRGIEDSPEKQARFEAEVRFMQERWGEALMADPAYSPNLTLHSEDFSLAWPPRA